MRPIDADALKYKQQVIYQKGDSDGVFVEWFITSTEIDNAPTIDAEPVVRCKDCTYYCPLDDSRPYDCLRSGMLCVRKEDFCSCGKERR